MDQHPAVIVVAQSAADVAQAVRFARRQGLGIAVQSGGHGVIRPADEAMLIVTNQLRQLRMDTENQRAWIGAGSKWGMVLEKTQEAGLAPLLGASPDVGVVGYTLGGGMGWLARKYGLAADSVIAIELVTASGEIIQASQEQNRDLFWGLRGGGGSFGVVTGLEIRLYPVTTVYGGNLVYPPELAREVITRYRELSDEAIDILVRHAVSVNGSSPLVAEEVRHAGGKISQVDPHFNAFGNRDAVLSLQVVGMTPTAEAHRQVAQYVVQMKQALAPYLTGSVYINFLEGEEARRRTHDAYLPGTYRKLQVLKAKYDPDNTLRFGFDIPPARA